MKKITSLTLFFLLFLSKPALANNPPAPQSALALISILLIMIILTSLGGGYRILRGYYTELLRLRKKSFLPRSPVVKFLGAFLLIFFSLPVEGPIILVMLIFGLIALSRGFNLFKWGLLSLPGRKRAWYLGDANPLRLITSGLILLLTSLFLMGMPFAYFGYSYPIILDDHYTDEIVRDIAAYQIAFSRTQKTKPDKILILDQKKYPEYSKLNRINRTYNIKLISNPNGEDFHILVIPEYFPFFPYNYFISRPSYMADHFGNIRVTYVHKAKPCPPEAQIVMKVQEKDIQKIIEEVTH